MKLEVFPFRYESFFIRIFFFQFFGLLFQTIDQDLHQILNQMIIVYLFDAVLLFFQLQQFIQLHFLAIWNVVNDIFLSDLLKESCHILFDLANAFPFLELEPVRLHYSYCLFLNQTRADSNGVFTGIKRPSQNEIITLSSLLALVLFPFLEFRLQLGLAGFLGFCWFLRVGIFGLVGMMEGVRRWFQESLFEGYVETGTRLIWGGGMPILRHVIGRMTS